MHTQVDIDIRSYQPEPDCPLMIGGITLLTFPIEMWMIVRVLGAERA